MREHRYPRFTPRPYRRHKDLWESGSEEFELLKKELSDKKPFEYGRMQKISQETGLAIGTLEKWRRQLRANRNWEPTYTRKGFQYKMAKEERRKVCQLLHEKYVERRELCTQAILKRLIENHQRQQDPSFTAGRTFLKNFMKDGKLSMRLAHVKRRSDPNDAEVAKFLERVELVKQQFPPDLIINVDETCWRLFNSRPRTVARTGSDSVQVKSKTDMKASITVIAACTAAGDRLPLWAVATGVTVRCETKFRDSEKLRHYLSGQLIIAHTRSGWSTEKLMIDYLDWLKERYKDRKFHVIWDLHASHRNQNVQDHAREAEIGLTYIPAGQTDTWQPLDRRIFGNLKMRSVAAFNNYMVDHSLEEVDICDALVMLCQCWNLIEQKEIREAWNTLLD